MRYSYGRMYRLSPYQNLSQRVHPPYSLAYEAVCYTWHCSRFVMRWSVYYDTNAIISLKR